MRLRSMLLACLALAAASTNLPAAFSAAEDQVLAARLAGAGGAWVAGPPSAEALYTNPAGLPLGPGLSLSGMAGQPGILSTGDLAGGVATLGLSDDLSLAASYDAFLNQARTSREETYSLAATLAVNPLLTVGLRSGAHFWQASQINQAVGQGVDLGARGQAPTSLGLPGFFTWGLALQHAAEWWPGPAWQQAVPQTFRAGLGYFPRAGWYLGAERAWISDWALPSGSYGIWRMGGEAWVTKFLALRMGWSDQPSSRASAGIGLKLPAGLGADYAVVYDTAAQALSHRLSLEWSLPLSGLPGAIEAKPAQVLRDPDGRLRLVQLALENAPANAQGWKLEIRDGQGNLLRVLSGPGAPPPLLAWDGKDSSGQAVAGTKLAYSMSILTPQGSMAGAASLDLNPSRRAFDLGALDLPAASTAPRPRLNPVLSAPGSGQLASLAIQMPGVNGVDVSQWQVAIKDSQGNVVKTIKGKGKLPAELFWDGKTDQGLAIQDSLGGQVVFSYTDVAGKTKTSAQSLFDQQSFSRAEEEASRRPEMQLAFLGGAGMAFDAPFRMLDASLRFPGRAPAMAPAPRRRPKRLRLALFAQNQADLGTAAQDLDDALDRFLAGRQPASLKIRGLCKPGEAGSLAAARARAVAREIDAGHWWVSKIQVDPGPGREPLRGAELEISE